MTELEQQFVGNYVKLVNQNRELQGQVTDLRNQLNNLAETTCLAIQFAETFGFKPEVPYSIESVIESNRKCLEDMLEL